MKEVVTKEEKVVVVENKKYIADDGKVFDDKSMCVAYEYDLKINKSRAALWKYAYKDPRKSPNENIVPVQWGDDYFGNEVFWAVVNNEDECRDFFENFVRAFEFDTPNKNCSEPSLYPAYIWYSPSVERVGTLEEVGNDIKAFYDAIGFNAEIKLTKK